RIDLGGHRLGLFSIPGVSIETNDNGVISNGIIEAHGTGTSTLQGNMPSLTVVSGSYSTGVRSFIEGSLTITGGSLDLGGGFLRVRDNLVTTSTGTLGMATNSGGMLLVLGSATFGGGSEVGLINNGHITIWGDFVQQGSSTFPPSMALTST